MTLADGRTLLFDLVVGSTEVAGRALMVLGERTGGMGMARGGAEFDGGRRMRADAGVDQDGGDLATAAASTGVGRGRST